MTAPRRKTYLVGEFPAVRLAPAVEPPRRRLRRGLVGVAIAASAFVATLAIASPSGEQPDPTMEPDHHLAVSTARTQMAQWTSRHGVFIARNPGASCGEFLRAIEMNVQDPWGHWYRFHCDDDRFAVSSSGADGTYDTDDDLWGDR